MKNAVLKVLIMFLAALIFNACQKDVDSNNNSDASKPHKATIYLTDHATPVFDSVFVDLQRLEVKLEDDTLPNDGWVNMNIRAGIYNILRFRNGLDTLFATGNLPNARLRKIKLVLGTQNSVMKNGQRFPLRVKDNDGEVIINVEADDFEITNSGAVLFWLDFDAGNSIQVDNSGSGNNNGYRLRSDIRLFTRIHSGEIEGKVLPRQADPIVKAILGTDTSTAIPRHDDGEFKIVGLQPGTYQVLMDGQNGYRDTLINNVIVRRNEDTHLAAITLRQ